MVQRRTTYRLRPEQVAPLAAFLDEHVLPVRFKHGHRLAGWWTTESREEMTLLWEYSDRAAAERFDASARSDAAYRAVPPDFYEAVCEEWVIARTQYVLPKVVAAACACVTNERGEVLLVRTVTRPDTWELPGGVVDQDEPLHAGVLRELREETGLEAVLTGLTGVYHHTGRTVVACFRAEVTGGELRPSAETPEVGFFPPAQAMAMLTRPTLRPRLEDALAGRTVPYEAFFARPYQLVYRLA